MEPAPPGYKSKNVIDRRNVPRPIHNPGPTAPAAPRSRRRARRTALAKIARRMAASKGFPVDMPFD